MPVFFIMASARVIHPRGIAPRFFILVAFPAPGQDLIGYDPRALLTEVGLDCGLDPKGIRWEQGSGLGGGIREGLCPDRVGLRQPTTRFAVAVRHSARRFP